LDAQSTPDWNWIAFGIIFACLLIPSIRYFWQWSQRKRYPIANANIQKGAVGTVSFGKGGSFPAAYMGYAFVVEGIRYAGLFVLYGGESAVQQTYEGLDGEHIDIYYKPSDPNISFLADSKDSRFRGLAVTQDPGVVNQGPSFDLQDAMRSAK
jgi:hypothetical protein